MSEKKITIEKTKVSMKHRGVRFSDDAWSEIKNIAKKESVSVSDVVRYSCEAFVEKYNKSTS